MKKILIVLLIYNCGVMPNKATLDVLVDIAIAKDAADKRNPNGYPQTGNDESVSTWNTTSSSTYNSAPSVPYSGYSSTGDGK